MNEAEQASWAVFLSLSGLGLSVVNSAQMEVAYGTMSSAPAMWEVEVKHKWKTLNMELASWLEEKWCNNIARVFLEDFLEVRLLVLYDQILWLERAEDEMIATSIAFSL